MPLLSHQVAAVTPGTAHMAFVPCRVVHSTDPAWTTFLGSLLAVYTPPPSPEPGCHSRTHRFQPSGELANPLPGFSSVCRLTCVPATTPSGRDGRGTWLSGARASSDEAAVRTGWGARLLSLHFESTVSVTRHLALVSLFQVRIDRCLGP